MEAQSSPDSEQHPLEKKLPGTPRRRKRNSIVVKIILDMIPVIAGILIALFINNLQQTYADKKLLKRTLEELTAEFTKNQSNIERVLPRQQNLLDTIKHYLSSSQYNLLDMTQKAPGMGTPEIYSTNWRSSFNNNSFRLMNSETVNLLSQIDSKHEELKEGERFIVSMVFGPPMFKRGEEGLEYRSGFELWMHSYMGNERELIELYNRFEDIVKNNQYHR